MKTIATALVTAGLVLSAASPSLAAQHKRNYAGNNSPSAIAERQRHANTFDPTQYYEHQLDKIPFGTRTWWDQYDREHGGTRH